MSAIKTRVLKTFDDGAVGPKVWSKLLSEGDTNVLPLTWQAQRLWWHAEGRQNGPLLIVADSDRQTKAIAPLFVEAGMVMNLCPATCLDFVGDAGDPRVLDAILQTVREHVSGFVGIRFYFVPDTSHTGQSLRQAATRLGLDCFLEDDQPSPIIDIRGKPEAALACTRKKTTLRRENYLRREGALEVHHFRSECDVQPQLEEFFEQHVSRWAETPSPSRFCNPRQRELFRESAREFAGAGWLRFSRLDWNGRPIAFHWGTCYEGCYTYSIPTIAVDLARYSPGAVMLRHLLLAAIDEGAHTFDFGLGDEAYKYRYATDVVHLQTWGLYPSACETKKDQNGE